MQIPIRRARLAVFVIFILFIIIHLRLVPNELFQPNRSVTSFNRQQCCEYNFTFIHQSPPFTMCLHPPGTDNFISDTIYADNGNGDQAFEAALRKDMLLLLKMNGDPNAISLDIGANIGLHTLFLANAGYTVHAFDVGMERSKRSKLQSASFNK
ncbi:hypothetical protein BCR33DRAFT_846507 [Rhizoclosmatium globosum]|uniref:Uncharacterized protein n=1 Tax=Rhizoclosmatium globosum TaxID=329046 RepID=A0A1Y2CUW8_9FUNG|nr:hypothetical protein BCR33DRAFT_846507 [Rhizoclosmatium globosum]|eukprot:ORY50802.1 hypothetical protein BCR33DRAFT_846507 [Rhizoclosmatium globosum]